MTAPTKLENLLNPQVVAEYIDAKLVDKIKLSPKKKKKTKETA